ncbi:hypothetical protein HGRIS_010479 [Hohenbuehelia grisea]|uniref:Uncharacterized protein n=1 Tax=Hohenbuehelia grisea TaxID=104357 RepID=A0ABR3IZD1_9AGAR
MHMGMDSPEQPEEVEGGKSPLLIPMNLARRTFVIHQNAQVHLLLAARALAYPAALLINRPPPPLACAGALQARPPQVSTA